MAKANKTSDPVEGSRLTAGERRAAAALSGVYALRMLGLFLVLPVFALYLQDFPDATPFLIGLALGGYGLTQAVLQIPFGLWSDRFGRKRLIFIGLLLFAVGSVVAAMADSVYGVIAGRFLQGAGAIASVVMALAADLSRVEVRTRVMAAIGASIGVSFAGSLVLGPALAHYLGLSGLFWFTALLGAGAIAVMGLLVPDPPPGERTSDRQLRGGELRHLLKDRALLRLDAGIFILHLVLTAMFVVIPLLLQDTGGLAGQRHWQVYLPVLGGGFLAMLPFLIIGERRRQLRAVFLGAIAMLAAALALLAVVHEAFAAVIAALVLFFAAFNLLEAALPSLVSRTAPAAAKGTALGIYSTSQFFGAFCGGMLGGLLFGIGGAPAVFVGCALLVLAWLGIAWGMAPPGQLSNYTLSVGTVRSGEADTLADRLRQVGGVAEAVVIPDEGLAYLKVDRQALDIEALNDTARDGAEAGGANPTGKEATWQGV